MEKRNSTKRLTESALLLAIAVVLELVSKLLGLELPFGGTITLASMFPVVLISYRYGVKWGLLSGFTYSLLQMIMGAKVVSAMFLPGEDQMAVWQAICVCLLDYVLAYTILASAVCLRADSKTGIGACTRRICRPALKVYCSYYIGCDILRSMGRMVLLSGGLL